MNFLETIKESVYSQKFYLEVVKKSFKQSLIYFLLLALLLTVIRVITLINPLAMVAPAQIKEFVNDVINCYPKDLEVSVKNGQVTTNTPEPYFVPNCKSLSIKNNQNFLVIDTKTSFSTEKFNNYQVEAWITKDAIIYAANNAIRTYNLKNINDFKLNMQVLNSYYNQFSPWFNFIGPLLILIAFAGTYLSYGFRLIHLFILALIVWLLSKAFKNNLTYIKSYKISLYALTLGLIVELIVSLTIVWTHFYGFPFMVTIITIGVVLANLFLPKKAS